MRPFLLTAWALYAVLLAGCGLPDRQDATVVFFVSGLPPGVTEIRVQLVQGAQTAERALPIAAERAELAGVRKVATELVLTAYYRGESLVVELALDLAGAADWVEQAVDFGYDPCDHEPMPELCPGAWTKLVADPAPTARQWPYCAFDGQHTVVVFGGLTTPSSEGRMNDVWSFDTESRAWQLLWEHTTEPEGSYPNPRYGGAAIISDNRLYVLSGFHALSGVDRFEVWTFDLSSRTWQELAYDSVGTVPANSSFAAAYDAALDVLWLFGGTAATGQYSVEPFFYRFDVRASSILEQPFLTTDDHHYIVDQLAMVIGGPSAGRSLVAFGGAEGSSVVAPFRNPRAETWAFEFQIEDWTHLSATGPAARFSATFTSLSDTSAMLFGGANRSRAFVDLWVYWFTDSSWTEVIPRGPAMPSARSGHCALAVDDGGALFLFGGNSGTSEYGVADLNDSWLFVVP